MNKSDLDQQTSVLNFTEIPVGFLRGESKAGVGKPAGAARRQLQDSQAGCAKLEILKYYIVHKAAWFDNRS